MTCFPGLGCLPYLVFRHYDGLNTRRPGVGARLVTTPTVLQSAPCEAMTWFISRIVWHLRDVLGEMSERAAKGPALRRSSELSELARCNVRGSPRECPRAALTGGTRRMARDEA